ncbi:MAG: hypothetical protein HOV79_00245, partial [Hamadaea sp.]|nr:hypothetical protein [Hamadaea sp.]
TPARGSASALVRAPDAGVAATAGRGADGFPGRTPGEGESCAPGGTPASSVTPGPGAPPATLAGSAALDEGATATAIRSADDAVRRADAPHPTSSPD